MMFRVERRLALSSLALALGVALHGPAGAQVAPSPSNPGAKATPRAQASKSLVDLDQVKVVGTYRESLQQSLDEKRYSVEQVDAIFAEDIGKFPDLNLAESMQRIAGVSIDRDAGEGRQISVRGLGSDFTRVRLNGLEALSTSGQGSSGPNRSRGFDFNTFASELFSEVKVSKTQSAQMDEGSLGATVDLRGSRPFDFDGFKASLSGQGGYNELSKTKDPRLSGLISNSWADGRFGALLSASWSKRTIDEEGFNPVRFDRGNYRNDGLTTRTSKGVVTRDDNHQYGFCSPKGYSPQTPRNPLPGELPTNDVNNGYGDYGIDADHCGTGLDRLEGTPENIAAYETATNAWNPRYPGWKRSRNEIERLGITSALQFKVSEDTLINLDMLYSKYKRDQREDTLGVNLHRAANLGGKQEITVREAQVDDLNRLVYGAFDNVDFRTESAIFEEETEFQQYSLNLDHRFNDDVRATVTLGHSTSDYARPIASLASLDNTNLQGFVWDARNSLKSPSMGFPFDTANPDSWQWLSYGNVPVNANGSARGMNISEVRLNPQYVDNTFDSAKVDLEFIINPTFTLSTGLAYKDYQMNSVESRHISYGLLPRDLPEGVTVGDISQTLSGYGKGLDGGAPGQWVVPDFGQIADLLDINCNCDTGVPGGNYTLAGVGHYGSTGNNFGVQETSLAGYMQLDFNTDLWDRPLRGNFGVRYINTSTDSSGWNPCPIPTPNPGGLNAGDIRCAGSKEFYGLASAEALPGTRYMVPISAGNSYNDFLPSLNVSWDLTQDVVLRFGAAKVMARPSLTNLSPGVSGVPSLFNGEDSLYSINTGNPKLGPYRATTYDLSAEWYFAEGALLSAAMFYKDISNYIQRVRQVLPYDQTGLPVGLLPEGFSGDEDFSVQSYYNTPGGPLKGFELTYQQPFTFLPGIWKNLGFQANFTRVASKLDYVATSSVDGTTRDVTTTYVENDLVNMSPQSYNATFYYDDGKFSARISTSYRDGYLTNVLVPEEGLDLQGNPVLSADVEGKAPSRYYDFNMSYKFTPKFSLTFQGTNLTDTFDDRYGDSQVKYPLRYTHTGRQYYVGARYSF